MEGGQGVKKYNFLSGSFWLFIGLGFTIGGFRYGFGSWHEPGPGLLPVVFGIALSALSLILLIATLYDRKKAEPRLFWQEKGSWKPVIFTILPLCGYMLLLHFVGFILTTFFLLFFLLKYVGKKRWIASILVALIFSSFSYFLFSRILGTPLPKGQLYGSVVSAVARV